MEESKHLLAYLRELVRLLRPGYSRAIDIDLLKWISAPPPWKPEEWILEGIMGSSYEFSHRISPGGRHVIFERRNAPTSGDVRTRVSADRAHLYERRPDGLYHPKKKLRFTDHDDGTLGPYEP